MHDAGKAIASGPRLTGNFEGGGVVSAIVGMGVGLGVVVDLGLPEPDAAVLLDDSAGAIAKMANAASNATPPRISRTT